MSLLDAWSAPKWQHKNPEVRLSALTELDDPEVLLNLANSDPDTAVQAAALARISDASTLDQLIETLPVKLQQQARQQRLRQLLPEPQQLANISDDDLLLRIASLSEDDELIAQAIARIESQSRRLEIAQSHPLAKIRLSAARGIHDIDALNQLMQAARGHDKGVYRHCKDLLDQHQQQQQQETARQQKIQKFIATAEALAEEPYTAVYAGRQRALQLQWDTASLSCSEEQTAAFQEAMHTCELQVQKAQQAAALAESEAAELRAAHQAGAQIQVEFEAFTSQATLPQNFEELAAMKAALEAFNSRWQAAAAASGASVSPDYGARLTPWTTALATQQRLLKQQSQIDQLVEKCAGISAKDYQALQQGQNRLTKLLSSFAWPELPQLSQPEALQRLQQSATTLNDRLAQLDKNQSKQAESVKALLQTLQAALEQNHSREADRALKQSRQAMAALPPTRREAFEHEIRPLAARLHEAHDWQDFAIEPKKAELCAQMQELIGSNEDVEILAVKIQRLQEQWKQAGALPHAQEQDWWLKFKAASDEAWKPCKAAFDQQAKLEKSNFAKRLQVVAQLEEYETRMAWPDAALAAGAGHSAKPDWPIVQKTLDTARAAFNGIKPVSPKAERLSQQKFRAICDRIYAHIEAEYQRNISSKESLVAAAEKLAGQTDLSKAIEDAKRLQQQWRDVGITPMRIDRKLWTAFRAACDAVFKRLDEQREGDRTALDTRVREAEALRDQARALVQEQPAESEAALPRTLAEMKQQLRAMELPSAVQQRLIKDVQVLEDKAHEQIRQARAEQQRSSWKILLDCILAAASQKSASPADETLQTSALPKGIDAKALQAFLQTGPGIEDSDLLREACIALEVLAETESPAADKQARMKYQMKRLAAGIGQQSIPADEALLQNINRFITLRPGSEWASRYCAVLQKLH